MLLKCPIWCATLNAINVIIIKYKIQIDFGFGMIVISQSIWKWERHHQYTEVWALCQPRRAEHMHNQSHFPKLHRHSTYTHNVELTSVVHKIIISISNCSRAQRSSHKVDRMLRQLLSKVLVELSPHLINVFFYYSSISMFTPCHNCVIDTNVGFISS